jgi:hypothetical protein
MLSEAWEEEGRCVGAMYVMDSACNVSRIVRPCSVSKIVMLIKYR